MAFFELENFLARSPVTRKVVFIDEMPWLDTPRSGFLTALESFWNNWACFRKDIVLIACGSATSWVVKNIIRNRDGLYGRVRLRIKLFPFTLFYRRFVKDNPSRSGDCWQAELSEGKKNDWRGFAFERLCLEHVPQIKSALDIAGVHTDVYSLRVAGGANRRGAQIDLLLDRRDGIVNLCEMKYASGAYTIDAEEAAKLRNRIEAFREKLGKRRSIHLTLVTSEGLAHKGNWAMVQNTLTLDDLFTDVKEDRFGRWLQNP